MGDSEVASVERPQQAAAPDIIFIAGGAPGSLDTASSDRTVALAILLAIYATNFMDRQIVAVLAEDIKRDLVLSDSQVGLLYGLAFAVLYTTVGIPIARFADRANRVRIIAWSLVLFSAMTAVCGVVGSYWQFFAARIGVAIGEGGTNPPSHSIISDLYPGNRRSQALAIFSLGPNIGIFFGFLFGGLVAKYWGWRSAFIVVGLGGLLLASITFVFLNEPERVWAKNNAPMVGPSSKALIRSLLFSSTSRHLLAGATLISVATYAIVAWLPSFLIRSHGFSTGTAGVTLALILGLVGGFGTFLGGYLADRLGARDPKWRLRIVALALVYLALSWPLAFLTAGSMRMLVLLILSGGLIGFFLGPTFATMQSIVDPTMRATAAALLLFVINVAGLGLGPISVGALSDAFTPHFGTNALRYALLIVCPLCAWAAYHYHKAAMASGGDQ